MSDPIDSAKAESWQDIVKSDGYKEYQRQKTVWLDEGGEEPDYNTDYEIAKYLRDLEEEEVLAKLNHLELEQESEEQVVQDYSFDSTGIDNSAREPAMSERSTEAAPNADVKVGVRVVPLSALGLEDEHRAQVGQQENPSSEAQVKESDNSTQARSLNNVPAVQRHGADEGVKTASPTNLQAIPPKCSEYHPAISGIELDDEPEIPTAAYVGSFIFAGCLNGIVGPPKAGKSTILFKMLLTLLEENDWIGEPTAPGAILYITEQSKRSFKAQLDRLPEGARRRILRSKLSNGNPAFFVMHPEHHQVPKLKKQSVTETDWKRNLRLWQSAIQKTDTSIIVIDTFIVFAGLGDAGENDNAQLASRISDLQELITLKKSLAVVLVFHANKAAAANQSKKWLRLVDIRGGNAIAGGLDHAVLINRPQRKQGAIARTLYVSIESRLVDEAMFTLTLQEDGSYLKEERSEAEEQTKKDENRVQKKIADAVAADPSLATLSIRDLADELGVKKNQVEKWKRDHPMPETSRHV